MPGSIFPAPAILRGTVDGLATFAANGGVTGAASGAQAVANGAAMQAAIDLAAGKTGSLGPKFLEWGEATININFANVGGEYWSANPNNSGGPGLFIPTSGFVWKAAKQLKIVQQASNCPVMTIGDPYPVVSGYSAQLGQEADIDGGQFLYANDQSTNTNATALSIGGFWRSRFANLTIGDESFQIKAYTALNITSRNVGGNPVGSGANFFSNSLENISCHYVSQSLLNWQAYGTQNVWRNIYLSNGVNAGVATPLPLAAPVVIYAGRGTFEGLNIEWCKSNVIVNLIQGRGMVFEGCHFEGCSLTGVNPTVVLVTQGGNCQFIGGEFLNLFVDKANATGTPSIFQANYGGLVEVKGTEFRFDGSSGNGVINMPWVIFGPETSGLGPGHYLADGVSGLITGVNVTAGMTSWDTNLPVARFGIPSARHYESTGKHSQLSGVQFGGDAGLAGVTAAPSIVYGLYGPDVLLNDVGLGQTTLTLSGLMSPRSNQARRPGDVIRYYHSTGGASTGTLTFLNDDTSTIATHNPIGALDYNLTFQWTGSAWTVAAPAAPGPVSSVVTTNLATSVIINWSAPTTAGDAAYYMLEYKLNSGSTWTTVSSMIVDGGLAGTSGSVTGLTTGVAYNFRITPYNVTASGAQAGAQTVVNATTHAQAVQVQKASWNVDGVNPTVTLPSTPTSGNTLLLWVSGNSGGTPPTPPSGATQIQALADDSGGGGPTFTFWTLPVTGGTARTITWTGSTDQGGCGAIEIQYYSTIEFAHGTGTASGSQASCAVPAPSATNGLRYFMASVQHGGQPALGTPPSGTTTLDQGNGHLSGGVYYDSWLLASLPPAGGAYALTVNTPLTLNAPNYVQFTLYGP